MGRRWSTKPTVSKLMDEARQGTASLTASGVQPHLAVIIAGDDPASHVYVAHKVKACESLGMRSTRIDLSKQATEAELLDHVQRLNDDPGVHGILVQLPLPAGVSADCVIAAIDPDKDVDGFHPINVGRLVLGRDGLFPCTPMGVMALLRDEIEQLSGKHAVVIGRSAIVGKPMAHLLLHANCSLTVIHSRTRDPKSLCRAGDIVVVAVGQTGMVDGSWLKPGCLVVDVGMNEVTDPGEASRLLRPGSKKMASFEQKGRVLFGDVDYRSALEVADLVTPVPGGVGKLTIAHLMLNCVRAAQRQLP